MKKTYVKTGLVALTLVFILVSLLYFPDDVMNASKRGLDIWWGIVFPTLLPFLIINEFLRSYGVVLAIGNILDPFMRPLFKVTGVGGYAVAMGMTSGMPVGAKIATQLRIENSITKTEAERLISFTNTANPLFIFGAVAVGFFKMPEIGILLAISHYGGSLITGVLMRFYKRDEKLRTNATKGSIFKRAYYSMHKKRITETRPFGKIFSDAVQESTQTLIMIGGFIIAFSVLNVILSKLNVIKIIFQMIPMKQSLIHAVFAGLFEMSLGAKLSGAADSTLLVSLLAVSFMLGFGGLSIHSQVLAIISESDIRYFPFFIAKLMHGLISVFLTLFLFEQFKFATATSIIQNVSLESKQIGPLITFVTIGLCIIILAFNLLKRKTF